MLAVASIRPRRVVPRLFLAALLMATTLGCGHSRSAAPPAATPRRIVSFSPALTRMLVDLGVGAEIVGRTRFCTAADPSVPVVGDLRDVNYERLLEVTPTHVYVQAPAAGVDRELAAMATRHGWALHAWDGIDDIDDVERVLRALPATLDPAFTRDGPTLATRVAEILNDLAATLVPVAAPGAPGNAGSVLLVYATEPVGVFGGGTYLDDVLRRLGGTNAVTASGWLEMSLEDVVHLDPSAIIVVRAEAPDGRDAAAVAGPL
ncbi:MAG: hypothetical protein KJO43_03155, partial [Phycisphaerae bacterium]|nr:hypothetical protein [Phycisphaerae bacterium]